MDVKEILRKHKLWLEGNPEGEKAELREADLSYDDLRGANLREADLRYADLTGSDLSDADLKGVNLTGANLIHAELINVNLRCADLSETDLRYADLTGVDLKKIKGKDIKTFQGSKHFAYSCDGYITIGCETHIIDYWKENYTDIGEYAGYSEEEIEEYGKFIRSLEK